MLIQIRRYLTDREHGLPLSQGLEAAWKVFYDLYTRKIRAYAFTCGAPNEEIADCVQEVWRELLVRLPTFQLDPSRGQFDTWLYQVVQGKTADLRRSRRHRIFQENTDTLQTVTDERPGPCRALEEEEMVTLAWDQLRKRVSECTFQVLQMRLVEQRSVAEVAEELGLHREQVWYRCHRARQELAEIGSALARGQRTLHAQDDPRHEKKEKAQKCAQGKTAAAVSRTVRPSSRARQGGSCVDYVFQRLELGRRELTPEWKVEWNCDALPRPVLYIRKMAIVAYAEICGSGDFTNTHWLRIANAAISAGMAAGIATIIATPTAALPIFQTEFHKQLQGRGGSTPDEMIQVALSAKQEANGPWCVCKD
jgi:RNA polymerase sigma factor (sigma-70 family)